MRLFLIGLLFTECTFTVLLYARVSVEELRIQQRTDESLMDFIIDSSDRRKPITYQIRNVEGSDVFAY